MVQETIQHGANRGGAQQVVTAFNRATQSHQCTGSIVPAHNEFEQFFGRRLGQLAHAGITDDEQPRRHEPFQVFWARTI